MLVPEKKKNTFELKFCVFSSFQAPKTFHIHPFLASPSPVFIALDNFLISDLSSGNP